MLLAHAGRAPEIGGSEVLGVRSGAETQEVLDLGARVLRAAARAVPPATGKERRTPSKSQPVPNAAGRPPRQRGRGSIKVKVC